MINRRIVLFSLCVSTTLSQIKYILQCTLSHLPQSCKRSKAAQGVVQSTTADSIKERKREKVSVRVVEVSAALTHHHHIYSAGEVSVASMFPHNCGEAGWLFSRKTPTISQSANHTTQAQEPAPKNIHPCALQARSRSLHAQLTTPLPPSPILLQSSCRWKLLCFDFNAHLCMQGADFQK